MKEKKKMLSSKEFPKLPKYELPKFPEAYYRLRKDKREFPEMPKREFPTMGTYEPPKFPEAYYRLRKDKRGSIKLTKKK